jgi:hypothetical protein
MLLVNHREHNEPDRGDAAEPEQFTTTPTTAGVMPVHVSISPDGKYLAYQEQEPRIPIRGRQGRVAEIVPDTPPAQPDSLDGHYIFTGSFIIFLRAGQW